MTRPPILSHVVLHLASYVGEAAKIAERLDEADGVVELEEAVAEARRHLGKRFDAGHWRVCLEALEEHLRAFIPEPDPFTEVLC